MASSSHKSHHDHYYYKIEDDEEEEEGDWLELGLGFRTRKQEEHMHDEEESNPVSVSVSVPPSSATTSSSPFQTKNQQIVLGLGLGLGLDSRENIESSSSRGSVIRHVGVAPPSNYHNLLWPEPEQDHCSYRYHQYCDDDNDNDNGFLPSWPCHMDSGASFLGLHNWQMPVPNDSHHYSCRRPQSGLWFTLHSLTNRDGETLPQIPKAYIRVKDENVTVFMVKKYLVRKLGLSNEAEIDISCMGQKLVHTQTLKQVRDAVWLPRLLDSINSTTISFEDSYDRSNNHLMSLHYETRCV